MNTINNTPEFEQLKGENAKFIGQETNRAYEQFSRHETFVDPNDYEDIYRGKKAHSPVIGRPHVKNDTLLAENLERVKQSSFGQSATRVYGRPHSVSVDFSADSTNSSAPKTN